MLGREPQGPQPNTLHNFWSMVHECDVHLIVMLTEVSGASKESFYTFQDDPSTCFCLWFVVLNLDPDQASGSYTYMIHDDSCRGPQVEV
jgi:protein tyrosine phosphatase